eukprot:91705-Hanusia_phi.AAC.1
MILHPDLDDSSSILLLRRAVSALAPRQERQTHHQHVKFHDVIQRPLRCLHDLKGAAREGPCGMPPH